MDTILAGQPPPQGGQLKLGQWCGAVGVARDD